MPLFVLVLFGFLISWPITSSVLAAEQFYNDELLSYDMAMDEKDIDYDFLSEDYLDYDNWSNETERETRELRFKKAYKTVTKSSTGNYCVKSCMYIYFIYMQTMQTRREPDNVCLKFRPNYLSLSKTLMEP